MWSNTAVIAFALVVGWMALFPIRGRLGPFGYHAISVPIGLLAWVILPVVTHVLGVGYTWFAVLVGHALWIGGLALAGRILDRRDPAPSLTRAVKPLTWPIAGMIIMAVAVAAAYARITVVGFDSLFHYDITGLWLLDQGQLDATIVGARSFLIPSLHAATRVLGGEWTYVVYPMLSVFTLALLGGVLYSDAFSGLRRGTRVAMTGTAVLVLAVMPNWVTHTFYPHSNLATAAYFTLAIASLGMASGFAGRREPQPVWAVPAGAAVVGFVLARPDGLAFLFVVLGLGIVLYLGRRISAATYGAFCLVALVPIAVAYGVSFAAIGVWESQKLSGAMALTLLAAAVVASVAGWVLARMPQVGAWASRGYNAIRLALALNTVIVSVVVYRLREKSMPEFQHMLGNLMDTGGWGFFWFTAAGIVVLSLLFADVTRRSAWSPYLLYVIAQFFAMSLMVYGLTDPGRLAWSDSFSRASLTVIPILFWYSGTFLGSLGATATRDRTTGSA